MVVVVIVGGVEIDSAVDGWNENRRGAHDKKTKKKLNKVVKT
jgi:hypothetical protein